MGGVHSDERVALSCDRSPRWRVHPFHNSAHTPSHAPIAANRWTRTRVIGTPYAYAPASDLMQRAGLR